MSKPSVTPEVSAYFSKISGGKALFKQRGSEYYRKIAAMRKNPGGKGKSRKPIKTQEPIDKEEKV